MRHDRVAISRAVLAARRGVGFARDRRRGLGPGSDRAAQAPVVPHEGHHGITGICWARSAGSRRRRSTRRAICAAGTSTTCRRTSRRSSIARRLGPTASMLREYEIFAVDREIEIAPGVKFPAWTYNGQVPGPTIRATEGDRLRVRFSQPGHAPAHDPLPRLASAGDGRLAAGARGAAGRVVRLRVRRRAGRPAPVSLPRRAAEAAHSQGPLRHVHRRSARRPSAGRRARDDDERRSTPTSTTTTRSTRSTRSPTPTWSIRSRSRSAGPCASIWSTSPSSI